MGFKTSKNTIELHEHHFKPDPYDPKVDRCLCGTRLISAEEFEYRQQVWEEYYEAVKATPGYHIYLAMQDAVEQLWKTTTLNHKPTADNAALRKIKSLRLQLKKYVYRGEDGELINVKRPRLDKPPFFDPTTGDYIVTVRPLDGQG